MIAQVIKRDGSIEDFKADKLNKWLIWATDLSNITDKIDWSSIILSVVKNAATPVINSQDLQATLIKELIYKQSWDHNVLAGRLEIAKLRKEMFGTSETSKLPTIKEMHTKLVSLGLMVDLQLSDYEYEEIERMVNHDKDYSYAHFQISYSISKYSIQNRVKMIQYETPQYTQMRLACALSLGNENRLETIKRYYDFLSKNIINAPTPYNVNLGTSLRGYFSCCLYSVCDEAKSLSIGDHIAYVMTYMSSGIGNNLLTRSKNDPVRGGAISHMGKLPYYKSMAGAVKANLQSGRGGACTTFFSCYDPEVMTIIHLMSPKSPAKVQNRDLDYAFLMNRFFAKQVISGKEVFLFNSFTAPDLNALFYSSDEKEFERVYNRYLIDDTFKKTFIKASEILVAAATQSLEVATMYYGIIDEINRHTPHRDTIYSSNLCMEIVQPTLPYKEMTDLYSTNEERVGEVSLCGLAAINVSEEITDTEYEEAAYYSLLMIDKVIELNEYKLPHIEVTAKARRNAGVGLIGVATHMARKHLTYDTTEGRNELHWLAERHSYFIIKASLKLGKELGNAKWMDRTKWPDGWLPIDTYNKRVDELVSVGLTYDWETLRTDIISNGGIRNSSLVAHMPTEASSKASGATNSVYPIRNLSIKKTDASNVIDWVAKYSDELSYAYQGAYSTSVTDQIKFYAVLQKFADQSISADVWRDRSETTMVNSSELINEVLTMVRYGVKTKYYTNSLTNPDDSNVFKEKCTGGGCTV